MKKEVVFVRGTFDGIYGWGKGFYTTEKAYQWEAALKSVDNIFWKVFTDHHASYDTHYLVATGGSVYLHPMDFTGIIHSLGNSSDSFDCKALKEVCDKIAEQCGGTFKLEVSKPFEIEADLVPYEEGIHNTL